MYSVLLVDDESIILDGLRKLIPWEDYGLKIKGTAGSGTAALDMMSRDQYDILITDVRMPDMSGLALLKELNLRNISIKSVILSGYDEFLYVKEAIRYGIENYLLKPVNEEELSATLLNIVEKLDKERSVQIISNINVNTLFENVLYRMLTGRIEHVEMEERAGLVGIHADKTYYETAVAKFFPGAGTIDTGEFQKTLQGFQCYDKADCRYFCMSPGNELMALFGSSKPIRLHDVRAVLCTVLNMLHEQYKVDWFGAIGSLSDGIQGVPNSYSNAEKMLVYNFILPNNFIVNYEDVKNRSLDIAQKFDIDYKKLDSLLLLDSEGDCAAVLDELFADIKNHPGVPVHELKCIIMEIIFHIFGKYEKEIGSFQENPAGTLLYDMLNMDTIDEVRDWLTEISTESIRKRKERKKSVNSITTRILDYVNRHYSEGISLKTLGDKLDLSPVYCGQIFKNDTGMLFTEYLCNYRIELAKRMLDETNLKSREIAAKVGFSNSNYFANVFKKKVGIYPTKYKLMCHTLPEKEE